MVHLNSSSRTLFLSYSSQQKKSCTPTTVLTHLHRESLTHSTMAMFNLQSLWQRPPTMRMVSRQQTDSLSRSRNTKSRSISASLVQALLPSTSLRIQKTKAKSSLSCQQTLVVYPPLLLWGVTISLTALTRPTPLRLLRLAKSHTTNGLAPSKSLLIKTFPFSPQRSTCGTWAFQARNTGRTQESSP